jgi:membrane-associated protein
LFAAGFFAAQGRLNLGLALIALFLGTFLGNIVGYEIGRRSGPRVFNNEKALLFNKQNVIYAQNFYKKHGGKTILIARFIPIIRTLAPLIAGIGKMRYRLFISYNFIGGVIWVSLVTMIGYWAGRVVGHYFNIDKYILPVVLLVTLITLGISFWQLWRDPVSRAHIKQAVKDRYKTFFKN